MQKLDLEVVTRESLSPDAKKSSNQIRREGWVPGVLYGHGESVAVAVNAKIFSKAIHTEAGVNAIFTVKLGDKSDMSIIKEVQRNILTQQPIHVDFQRINVKDKIEVTIPIHLQGESNGVKNQGGVLEHMQREVRIKCLPADLIPSITVNISKLDLHQSIKVSDLVIPAGVEFVTPTDHVVVNIVLLKVEEEKPLPGAEGTAAAQPEVIAKGKKDEEGAAPAAGGAAPTAAAPKAEKKK